MHRVCLIAESFAVIAQAKTKVTRGPLNTICCNFLRLRHNKRLLLSKQTNVFLSLELDRLSRNKMTLMMFGGLVAQWVKRQQKVAGSKPRPTPSRGVSLSQTLLYIFINIKCVKHLS